MLDIESALGQGRPLGSFQPIPGLLAAEEELDAETLESGGVLPMCWRETNQLFEPFQLREDSDYFIDITVPLSLADVKQQATIHPAWPFDQRLTSAFKREPVRRWREVLVAGRAHTIITAQLRLRSHAGVIHFATQFGGYLRAEVVCRKLRYFDEFKLLLDKLAEKAAELLLAYDSPVSLSFSVSEDQAETEAALHFLMRHVMSSGNLPVAVEEILANPHVRLLEQTEATPVEELEEADPELIVDSIDLHTLSLGGPLSRVFRGFTPTELPRREAFESHDTPENRYAKAFLEHCRLIAQRLENLMALRRRRAAEREARVWGNLLDELLQYGLWREVGPLAQVPTNSQVLLRKRGYKELFRFDITLRMRLALAWKQGAELADGLVGDVRPVSHIYEYWCFFTLREILSEICPQIGGGDFLTVSKDGLRIQLSKGQRSECRFEFESKSGIKVHISLFYNRRFSRPKAPRTDWFGSYTASFDPDFSIVARIPGHPAHWFHFDAKYRLDRQEAEDLFQSSGDQGGGESEPAAETDYTVELSRVHKQDDLFKMHTYRDGILGTRGAYVLFPGDGVGGQVQNPNPNFFVRHPSAFGTTSPQSVPSVGAFPLAPEHSGTQTMAVRALLSMAFEAVASGSGYREEDAYFP
ncbi:DUF2357 domain-containing protein [Pararobbsia alpina]|uniref:DUF2357 domain-containing protein n=1 Tax=Pararobbsia alpina TaxID=621374 RepID=UPI001C2ED815|nr:DUF2357 domain-containing protein [Pararobbsia alpina]